MGEEAAGPYLLAGQSVYTHRGALFLCGSLSEDGRWRARKMAEWVKVLPRESDDLRHIPGSP